MIWFPVLLDKWQRSLETKSQPASEGDVTIVRLGKSEISKDDTKEFNTEKLPFNGSGGGLKPPPGSQLEPPLYQVDQDHHNSSVAFSHTSVSWPKIHGRQSFFYFLSRHDRRVISRASLIVFRGALIVHHQNFPVWYSPNISFSTRAMLKNPPKTVGLHRVRTTAAMNSFLLPIQSSQLLPSQLWALDTEQ